MKSLSAVTAITLLVGCTQNTELYSCHLVGNDYETPMKINYRKNEIYYDEHNIYDIKHINRDYITSYARFGTGAGVGGGVEVFNRNTLLVTSSDIEHANYPSGTDEISTSTYKSQCKRIK